MLFYSRCFLSSRFRLNVRLFFQGVLLFKLMHARLYIVCVEGHFCLVFLWFHGRYYVEAVKFCIFKMTVATC